MELKTQMMVCHHLHHTFRCNLLSLCLTASLKYWLPTNPVYVFLFFIVDYFWFWLGGAAPQTPQFWVGVFARPPPLTGVLSIWRRPNVAASIKCFFFGAVRSSLAFDRGGQTGPPRSNAFFFPRRWQHGRRRWPSGWTSGRTWLIKKRLFSITTFEIRSQEKHLTVCNLQCVK